MNRKLKYLLCLIAAIAASALLSGCGGDDTANTPSDTTAQNTADTTSADTAPAETTRQPLEVPSGDYGGVEFNIMSPVRGETGSRNQFLDFAWSDDRAGDLINDAVYARNLAVEEAFNVKITNQENDNVLNSARPLILSGDEEYEVMQPNINDGFTLGMEGLFVDFFEMPGIDLDNPWWDHAIVRDLALCGKLYTATGDISMADEELNYAVFFNKALIDTYNLDDMYQLVRDDKWILDKMEEMATTVTHDLNGDGLLTSDDVYGILSNYSTASVWFFSFGGQMATINEDGVPEIVIMNERNVKMLERMANLFQNKQAFLNADDAKDTWTGLDNMLMEDRGLFRIGSIYDITHYRSMVNDFGILPYPKLDENQEDFYHLIATNVAAGIAVPITNTDLERTGILLEALAYGSKDTVTKAYYDINLYTKVARDEESGEMLDIIFSTKRYDIAYAFGWGNFNKMLDNSVRPGGNFTTLYAAAEESAQAQLEKTYEKFNQ